MCGGPHPRWKTMSSPADKPPVELWRRALAGIIDAAPTLCVATIAAALVIGTDPSPPDIPPWNPFDIAVDYFHLRTFRFLLATSVFFVIAALLQALQMRHFGATLGMRVLGLRARRAIPADPPPGLTRLFAWQLAGLGLGLFAGLTWWWGFVDMRRLTLHDRLAVMLMLRR